MKKLETVNQSIIEELNDISLFVYDYEESEEIFENTVKDIVLLQENVEAIIDDCKRFEIKRKDGSYNFGLTYNGSLLELKIMEYFNNELIQTLNHLSFVKDIVVKYEPQNIASFLLEKIDDILKPIILWMSK